MVLFATEVHGVGATNASRTTDGLSPLSLLILFLPTLWSPPFWEIKKSPCKSLSLVAQRKKLTRALLSNDTPSPKETACRSEAPTVSRSEGRYHLASPVHQGFIPLYSDIRLGYVGNYWPDMVGPIKNPASCEVSLNRPLWNSLFARWRMTSSFCDNGLTRQRLKFLFGLAACRVRRDEGG